MLLSNKSLFTLIKDAEKEIKKRIHRLPLDEDVLLVPDSPETSIHLKYLGISEGLLEQTKRKGESGLLSVNYPGQADSPYLFELRFGKTVSLIPERGAEMKKYIVNKMEKEYAELMEYGTKTDKLLHFWHNL
ncbi:MAG: hypothetical protein GXP63_03265 [DPANN group archaeon]|nr:hypothetical protein [DPANN group archaeon]